MNQLERPYLVWGIAALVVLALLRGCVGESGPKKRHPVQDGSCRTCDGSGRVACGHCNRGWVKTYNNPDVETEGYSCAVCGGDGLCTCTRCGGSGY